ncbi:tRNA uridine-5-carboxymethylaminomethyl(34) synthesis GTPase MnmE [Chitinispirillales bacterium ANBcel5]|uniref:tRNA uridine-5-carboxymethylaminomethyl(34) synthesis GTPase MnmE n=1 Tax=Cellulosispirillum alkaliphilum TaxID=3039283 RepID=UPI002A558F44|nr:tRNA uridine-5-carboxymethylaminomethyl(34) synthesis GTPase MnmE [Chitinispirillales bacterium ANBcel5]
MVNKESTIVALATPQGKAALAVLRITGPHSYAITEKIVANKEKLRKTPERQIQLYEIINSSLAIIDEVTAVKYKTGKSYTGEEMVEIICHGSPSVVKEIIEELYQNGAKPAAKGEFTRRAFLNGKLDLLKAEAIGALIDSQTSKQKESAKKGLTGNSSRKLQLYREKLITILSEIEAQIEFGEEDDIKSIKENPVEKVLKRLKRELTQELNRAKKFLSFNSSITIVIAGPPNAGKSSLFNMLLGEQRSIVYKTPGTTRDSISEEIEIKGNKIKVIDSAGIRLTNDDIEKIGIERSIKQIEDANAVLWVTSACEEFKNEEKQFLENNLQKIVILNKIDISSPNNKKHLLQDKEIKTIPVSIKEGINTDRVYETINKIVEQIVSEIETPDIVCSHRQLNLLEEIVQGLNETHTNIDNEEIAAYYLNSILQKMEEFFGYTASEEILNSIFGRFCIGK